MSDFSEDGFEEFLAEYREYLATNQVPEYTRAELDEQWQRVLARAAELKAEAGECEDQQGPPLKKANTGRQPIPACAGCPGTGSCERGDVTHHLRAPAGGRSQADPGASGQVNPRISPWKARPSS